MTMREATVYVVRSPILAITWPPDITGIITIMIQPMKMVAKKKNPATAPIRLRKVSTVIPFSKYILMLRLLMRLLSATASALL
jgi:hypothetical protein